MPNRRKSDADALRVLCDPARSLFEVLGAQPASTPAELSALRRVAARVAHPDLWAEADAVTRVWANDAMSRVNQAYATLTNAQERRRYLMLGLPKTHAPCETCKGEGKIVWRKGFSASIVSTCAICLGAGYLPKPKKE